MDGVAVVGDTTWDESVLECADIGDVGLGIAVGDI